MKKTKRVGIIILALAGVTIIFKSYALALPTFQTYISGATASDFGGEQDTWFSSANPFNLYVVGAYKFGENGMTTKSITGVTLLVSVPNGKTGTLTFTSLGDGIPALLTTIGQGSPSGSGIPTNPTADANTPILTTSADNTGYSDINKPNPTFLPDGLNLNNHYPLQNNASDFLIYDLLSFDNSEFNLNDYNADGGPIQSTSASGEQKKYSVSYTGFNWVHFDVYGWVTDEKNSGKIESTWDNNPGSHDSTADPYFPPVPEPASLSLLGLGLLGLVGLRKKKI